MDIRYTSFFINTLGIFLFCTMLVSCGQSLRLADHEVMPPFRGKVKVRICLREEGYHTRAVQPEEERINDVNLFIFNEEGILEKHLFLEREDLGEGETEAEYGISLLENVHYSIKVAANIGYQIRDINNLEEMENFRFYLAYPDEFPTGIPMVGSFEGSIHLPEASEDGEEGEIPQQDEKVLDIELRRIVSKISVSMDRSRLDKDIEMTVKSICIKQAPKSSFLFKKSRVLNEEDVFANGYYKEYGQADALNQEKEAGISEEVSLFMLENRLGELLPDAVSAKDKVLEGKKEAAIASYIEMQFVYQSDDFVSLPEEYLIYRFYLGENVRNFSIERNCHYHYIVRPEGDGLKEVSWRVDKSSLSPLKESELTIHPSEHIKAHIGEELHVWAELKDPTAQFDIGLEELDYEKERGMFDYVIDPDGRGVRLHLKQQGTAILYMSSGSHAAMAVIVIDPAVPEETPED